MSARGDGILFFSPYRNSLALTRSTPLLPAGTQSQSITLAYSWSSFKTPTECNFPFETSPEPPYRSRAPAVLPAYFYSIIFLYFSDLRVCSSRWVSVAKHLILESSFPLEHHGTFSCWVRSLLKTATASSNQLALIHPWNLFAISALNCAVLGISYLSVCPLYREHRMDVIHA